MWTLTGCGFVVFAHGSPLFDTLIDDSAAHVSEEIAGAARAAPIAILVGVGGTASLGWLLLIAASYATSSVSDLLQSTLPLQIGQLFLDTLGKRGMLAIWSFIIVVQVGVYILKRYVAELIRSTRLVVCHWCCSRGRCFPSGVRFRQG